MAINNMKIREEMIPKMERWRKLGMATVDIANGLRISPTTLYNWLERGEASEDKNDIYYRFYKTWYDADAEFVDYHLDKIAGSRDWRASQYILSVRKTKGYDKEERIKLEQESKVEVNLSDGFNDEAVRRILEQRRNKEQEQE